MSTPTSVRTESPRTVRQTAAEVALLSVMAIMAGVVLPIVNAASGGQDPLKFFIQAGNKVVDMLGAVVPVHAAVLVAFYVVVLGGQILGKPDEAQRLRRLLALIAELLAAAMAPVVVYALGYCFASKTDWVAMAIMWFPVIAVEFFFAVQLGVFNFFPMAVQVQLLDQKVAALNTRLESLQESRTMPNMWWVLLVFVPAALLMTWILSPSSVSSGTITFLLSMLFSVLVAVTVSAPLYIFRTNFDPLVRYCCWVIPAVVYGALVITAVALMAADETNARVGWAWLAALTWCLLSFVIPGRAAWGPFRFLSIQFVVGQLAFRRVRYWRNKAANERDNLQEKLAAADETDNATRSRLALFIEAVRSR